VNAPGLRKAIERAREANMPQANIERAIKKGSGKDAATLEGVMYEAYGPGGSAIVIEGLTDNRNRTSAEIKHVLGKYEASLAGQGAASWAFEKKDEVWIPKTTVPLVEDDKKKLEDLVQELEENEDIQSVFVNTA